MQASPQKHVLVIGGGVIGAFSAYYLAQSGVKVTIIERGRFAGGCSHANCGLISPSHVLPLAQPKVLTSSFKALFKPNGPFSIRPRADMQMLNWLMQFALQCNQDDMIKGGHARHQLLVSSAQLYKDLIKEESFDCEYQQLGCLFVYPDKNMLDAFDRTNQLLTDNFNVPARKLIQAELTTFEPALKSGLAGAWFYEIDGHLRPDRLMKALRDKLMDLGVSILEYTEAFKFETDGENDKSVRKILYHQIQSDGQPARNNATLPDEQQFLHEASISVDKVLFATGAWSPKLNQLLGCRIPIQPGKGYSMTMSRPSICPQYPMILEGHRVAVTPMASGYRLGSTMQFAGYDSSLDASRLKLLTEGASHYLREPFTEAVSEKWFGWRPMTVDGVPIIDQSPSYANVYIAAGHNMLGLSMAPATGRLVRELMLGQPSHIDPAPYRISRFMNKQ